MVQQLRALTRPVVKSIKQLVKSQLDPIIHATTGLVPISEFMEEDIFIVGYPKSGNTWFQNLVSGVVYGVNPEYTPDTLIQELVPDVHYKRYYKRYWTPMFFKSHQLPKPEYKKVVYLIRDGRDVMVSYYHYLTAISGHAPDFVKMVETGEGLICQWHEHVEVWLSNPYQTQMIIIKYEDLKCDTVNELRRFCEFVNLNRDDLWLKTVVTNSSFEKMHRKEKDGHYFFENSRWPKGKFFIRRGKVGSYQDEMPPNILEAFLQNADQTLRKCGYLV